MRELTAEGRTYYIRICPECGAPMRPFEEYSDEFIDYSIKTDEGWVCSNFDCEYTEYDDDDGIMGSEAKFPDEERGHI